MKNLKNYKTYWKKLETLCKLIRYDLGLRPVVGDGVYIPSHRRINVDPNQSETGKLSTLLHEIGHLIDDGTITDLDKKQELNDAYHRMHDNKKLTKRHKKIILACETRAWMYGRSLAHMFEIKLGRWYEEEQEKALDGYRSL